MATAEDRRLTDSGIEIAPVYTADDLPPALELPGEHPFTRSVRDDVPGRPWTIRQYAGYGSAEETNTRFLLLERGQTGLSVAFDLPTQLGYDSDDPLADGEVGRTGVAIDSVADMEVLLDGIPLGEVSTSMTINAPAALLLLLYELRRREAGRRPEKLRGIVQNDVLKEYVARGNYIFPPRPSMRLTTDLFAYCASGSRTGTRSRSPATTSARPGRARRRSSRSRSRTGSRTARRRSRPGSRPTIRRAALVLLRRYNHFFQEVAKFRAPRGACGRGSCASASARRTRARRRFASTPRREAQR